MRIGEFAKNNNISIDTVRYYIQLNLIHPIRKGKYFYFEHQQQKQLDKILKYKEMRFSLDEIKKLIHTEKFNLLETNVKSSLFEEMLAVKKDEIHQEINLLNDILVRLNDEIEIAKHNIYQNISSNGMNFNNLEILCCPQCHKNIIFKDGTLKDNGIYYGKAECTCGSFVTVNEGIIISSQSPEDIFNPSNDYRNHIDEFINNMPQSFIELMLHYLEEIIRYLDKIDLSDKIVISIKSGAGTLGLNLLNTCHDIKTLILVEEDINKLRIAKRTLDKLYADKNIIYICSELNSLPLKLECIDIAIDFLATFVNGFRISDNQYEFLLPHLKSINSIIIGLYFYFKDLGLISRLEKEKRKLFDEAYISDYLRAKNFNQVKIYEEKVLKDINQINDFFKNSDKVYANIKVYKR